MANKCVNNPLQVAYLRRYTLTDGKEAGLKVVEMDNGVLRVLLNESKALDIMQVWHKGVNMSYVCKNGFTGRELPFAKRFEGGMLYTCGIDCIGGIPGFEPHGSFHNTPSKIISLMQLEDKLEVKAQIEVTALFGDNLVLERTITLPKNSAELMLEDTLVNRGTREANYCLLYHVNIGYPMLDAGVEIEADLEAVTPRTPHAAENLATRVCFPAPIDNEAERCYFLNNASNWIRVKNQKLGRKVTLTYSRETLPAFVQWNSPASQDYVLGLEPATSVLGDGFTYRKLPAGESREFTVCLSFEDI